MGSPRAQLQDVSKCLLQNASFWGRGEKTRYHWLLFFFFCRPVLWNSPRHPGLSQLSAPLPVCLSSETISRHAPHAGAAQTIFAFRYQDCKMPPLKAARDWPFCRRRQSARETFNSLGGFISKGPDEGEHKLIDHCFPGKRSCIPNEWCKTRAVRVCCVCGHRGGSAITIWAEGDGGFEWNYLRFWGRGASRVLWWWPRRTIIQLLSEELRGRAVDSSQALCRAK